MVCDRMLTGKHSRIYRTFTHNGLGYSFVLLSLCQYVHEHRQQRALDDRIALLTEHDRTRGLYRLDSVETPQSSRKEIIGLSDFTSCYPTLHRSDSYQSFRTQRANGSICQVRKLHPLYDSFVF